MQLVQSSSVAAAERRVAVVVVVLALGGPATQAAPAQKPAQAIPGELLIGFRSDVSAAEQKKVLRTIGAAEKKSFKGIPHSPASARMLSGAHLQSCARIGASATPSRTPLST